MTTIEVELPEALCRFVEGKAEEEGHRSSSEYIRHLVAEAHDQVADRHLEALALEGLDSGESFKINQAWWDKKKSDLRSRVG